MNMIDIALFVLYSISITGSLYIIHSHMTYFYERFQKGMVSVFMLAMLFFLMAYTFKMIIILLIRLTTLLGPSSPELMDGLRYGGILAQLGMTGGIIALAVLTHSGKYDQFIYMKKIDGNGGKNADANSGKK